MASLLEQRCTAAGRHGHLPQAARFSTPPHSPADHSACAGDRPWLGRAITCHSASAMLSRYPQRGLRQVRFLRKLMPGEGFCMHVLCYLLKTLERYAVPAAIATCCPGSIRALLTPSLMWCCALLSFVHILQVSCICLTVLTSAGAFERSEIQEWPLDGVSGLRCSAGPFVGERDVCAVSILLQRTCRLDSPGTCVH